MEVPRLYKRSDKFMKSGKERSNIVPNSSKHKKPAPTSGVRRSGGASRQTPEEVDEGGIPGRVFKENVDLRHIRELLRHKDCCISENSCGTKKVGLSQGDIEFLGLVLQKAEAEDNPGLYVVSTQYKKSKSGELYATNKASLGRASPTLRATLARANGGRFFSLGESFFQNISRCVRDTAVHCCADATRHQATRPTGEDEDSETRSADTAGDLRTPEEEARAAVGTGPSHKEEDDSDVWDGFDQFDMDTPNADTPRSSKTSPAASYPTLSTWCVSLNPKA
jgi:hypothetical protein